MSIVPFAKAPARLSQQPQAVCGPVGIEIIEKIEVAYASYNPNHVRKYRITIKGDGGRAGCFIPYDGSK